MPQLTLDQKIGQRFMLGVDSTRLDDELKRAIDGHKAGGVILFARNIETPGQITALCGDAQAYAARCGQPPLFIAVDQEGGQVARLKPPFTQFPGHPPITGVAEAERFARITAGELMRIGINMDMAPVLDVLPTEGPSVMAKRAFGSDPEHVAALGATVIEGLQQRGILSVGKHFPGIGRTVLDSHEALPDLEIDLSDLETADLIPFRKAIDCGVAGIMLSHIRYLRLDPHWPGSLSPAIAGDLLRRRMGYGGLVITDDLDMGAVAKHYDLATIVTQCLAAEVDILLICHPGAKIDQATGLAKGCIQDSDDLRRLNDLAVERIMAAKSRWRAS